MGRSNRYLESSQTRKEPIARKIAEKEGIEEGLICVLRAVEPCMSYDIYRNRQVSRRLNPAHGRIFRGLPIEYYWTVHQDEWATDLMFRSTGELAALYPARVRGAMACFTSPGVMRFLEKKPHGSFAGEVVSDFCQRPPKAFV